MKTNYSNLDSNELIQIIYQKEDEIDKLAAKAIDLAFELNYNKQTELIEFLRELYDSCKKELNPVKDRFHKPEEKSSKEILTNLVKYIEEFAKNNKILL